MRVLVPILTAAYKAQNFDVVADERYERGLADFNPLLSRLLAAGIDPSLRRREVRQMNDDGCAVATEYPGIWRQAG